MRGQVEFPAHVWGRKFYFWGGVLVVVVLVLPVVFLVWCFLLFLVDLLSVLFWSGWVGVSCAKVNGNVAAAKTIASKLFFM